MRLIILALIGFFALAFALQRAATPKHNDSIDIICDANTETLISEEHEYPAWTLECHNTKHRIIVID